MILAFRCIPAPLQLAQIFALVAPRPVVFAAPTARMRTELAGLKGWYEVLGADFDPLRAVRP